jgi:hypothetical protein
MPTKTTTWAVEIVLLVAVLVAVEWLSMTLTHGRNFPALLLILAVYLGVRVAIATRKRSS